MLLLALRNRDGWRCSPFARRLRADIGLSGLFGALRRTLTTPWRAAFEGQPGGGVLEAFSTARVMEVTDLIDSTVLTLRQPELQGDNHPLLC